MNAADRARFFNRLGYYLMGVALGLVLLGVLYQAKRAMTPTAPVDPAGTPSAHTP